MRGTKRFLKLISAVFFAAVLALALTCDAGASAKFSKETGKKCLDCHKKLPKKGDKDLQLTELGQKFKDNGNKL